MREPLRTALRDLLETSAAERAISDAVAQRSIDLQQAGEAIARAARAITEPRQVLRIGPGPGLEAVGTAELDELEAAVAMWGRLWERLAREATTPPADELAPAILRARGVALGLLPDERSEP